MVAHTRPPAPQNPVCGAPPLTRNSPVLGPRPGFEIRDAESFYGENAPRFLVAQTLGVAVSP